MQKKEREVIGVPVEPCNEVSIAGRLAVPPRIKEVKGGHKMASLLVAVKRTVRKPSGGETEETAFVPVIAWRAIADRCEALVKGSPVRLQGCLRTWRGDDGYRWQVEANLIEPVAGKKS